jgi:hypothetical protein
MPRFSLRALLIVIAIASVLLGLWAVAARQMRHHDYQLKCISNGKHVSLAVIGYKETYGEDPPRVVYGPDGKPWHSWRVLILEFLDPALFARYSFDEPWDGPNNSKLLSSIPEKYRCLNDRRENPYFTSYFYERAKPGGPSEWQIVEARHDIPWMAPDDGLDRPPAPPDDCGPPTVLHLDTFSIEKPR